MLCPLHLVMIVVICTWTFLYKYTCLNTRFAGRSFVLEVSGAFQGWCLIVGNVTLEAGFKVHSLTPLTILSDSCMYMKSDPSASWQPGRPHILILFLPQRTWSLWHLNNQTNPLFSNLLLVLVFYQCNRKVMQWCNINLKSKTYM